MSKWLNSFLQKRGHSGPGKSDKGIPVSAMSVFSKGLSLEMEKNRPTTVLTELTRSHQSGLSVPPKGLFPANGATPPLLNSHSLLDDYEERLAIAEWEGGQSPLHAQRIAYQDAFIATLVSLPEQLCCDTTSPQEWLSRRIHSANAWLTTQDSILRPKEESHDHRH